MWIYTFFPGVAGGLFLFFFYFLPQKCCLDGRGRKGDTCSSPTGPWGWRCCWITWDKPQYLVVVGFESCLSCNRMATGDDLMLLGGSKAGASVGCQTCHKCLCKGRAGNSPRGAAVVCSSTCGHRVGFASQILGPFLHWPQSQCLLHLAHCVKACLAPSFLRGFLWSGWLYTETCCLFLLFC